MALKTTNLQIHYDFSNATCYPGSGTTITNLGLAGATYNGTVSATSIRAGTPNGTLPTFNSTQNAGIFNFVGDKGRIAIPNGSVTQIPNNSTPRTIQAWVKWNSLTCPTGNQLTSAPAAPFFGKLSPSFGFDGYIGYAMNTGSLRLTLNAAAESIPATANSVITTNQWYFITMAFTTANADNAVKFYKEATQQTITPTKYTGTWTTTETNELWLGAGFRNPSAATYGGVQPGGVEAFSGWIGGFYMYDTILTAQEVTDNWNATKARYVDNNLKYWNGSAWTVPTNKYQWDGTNWVTMNGKYWNGSAWVALT